MTDPRLISAKQAGERLAAQADEFAVVDNPGYVHPAREYYPLAPKIVGPVERLVGAVMDMDGTTTTTETLCLHSLETMVRRITGRLTTAEWPGLDRDVDYPNVIGNSTTRHVEYLVGRYGEYVDEHALAAALIEAARWTLSEGADETRRREVRATLAALGGPDDPARTCAAALELDDFNNRVRAAIDIYYHRYHEILSQIAQGRGRQLADELTGGEALIEPMPGVAIFLALVSGRLGARAAELYDLLRGELTIDVPLPDADAGRRRLAELGRRFEQRPMKLAVVTSSIAYEAEIVLGEVLSAVSRQIADWPVASEIAADLDSPQKVYHAVVTASDSSEIRLKPHRDLYSIALRAVGIAPADFDKVVGFEDSESGTIAIRAAGVGLCVAVPFADTSGHDFAAAAHVAPGGLPQVILQHNLFLQPGT